MTAQGDDLVMIHGLLGSLSFFGPRQYLPKLNVFTPDMHGYGDVGCLDNLSLQNQADYIKQYVVKNINDPCWILGHSVGAAIANIFASKNRELVKGIINVEGNFTLNDAFWCQKISNPIERETLCTHLQQFRHVPPTTIARLPRL